MAELRQLTRRVQDLEQSLQANPLELGGVVEKLSTQVADLEQKLVAYKGFLEDALAKLGLMEQKVVSLESKTCQCGSEYSIDAESTPMTTVVMAENPIFQESASAEPAPEPVAASEILETVVEVLETDDEADAASGADAADA